MPQWKIITLCVSHGSFSKVYGIAVKYNLSKINIMDLLKGATAHETSALYYRHEQG